MKLEFGKKVFESLSSDAIKSPAVAVVPPGKGTLAEKTGLKADKTLEAAALSVASLDELAEAAKGAGTIIAIGDSIQADAARYAAWKNDAVLVVAPQTIDSERIFRKEVVDGESAGALGEKPADIVAVDYSLVWSGDEDITRSSVGDVLGAITAAEDWKRSAKDAGYDEDVAERSLDLLSEMMDRADDIFDLTEGGIRAIAEAMAGREGLAEELGHRRTIEGSEHVFADCARAVTGREYPHGPLMCLSVITMTELQGKPSKAIKQFLHWIRVPWRPDQIGFSDADMRETLKTLRAFSEKHGYPPTSINMVEMMDEKIDKIINGVRESILRSSLMDRED